jgi:predicted methyltransferase
VQAPSNEMNRLDFMVEPALALPMETRTMKPSPFPSPCSSAPAAQVAVDANKSYQSEDGRKRMVENLTGEHRDARQKPKELIAALGIGPGMRVADIGSGPGYARPVSL